MLAEDSHSEQLRQEADDKYENSSRLTALAIIISMSMQLNYSYKYIKKIFN